MLTRLASSMVKHLHIDHVGHVPSWYFKKILVAQGFKLNNMPELPSAWGNIAEVSKTTSIQVFAILIALDFAIIALYGVHLSLGGWPQVINLDGEHNLGAWWGGGKFLLAGQAVAASVLLANGRAPASVLTYLVIAGGFVFLSADEILSIHEKITALNKKADLGIPMLRDKNGAWISVYAGLGAFLLLVFHRQLIAILRHDFTSAGLVALGMAMAIIGGVFFEAVGYYSTALYHDSGPQIFLEESFELLGVSVLLFGCWRHQAKVIAAPQQQPRHRTGSRAISFGQD